MRWIMTILLLVSSAAAEPARVFEQAQLALSPLISPALGVDLLHAPPGVGQQVYAQSRAAAVELLLDDRLEGTGFIIDPAGRVITAGHVVEVPRRRIEARTVHGRVQAHLLALDLGHDLALLQLGPPPKGSAWPHLSLAERTPPVTSPVYLLGTPIFRHHVMLQGIVARDLPTFEYLSDERRYVSIMHLSALSPSGTSGGPWMNARGEVIGVQSGMMHAKGRHLGVAYMAPLDAIRALVRRGVDARTASLGVVVEEIWGMSRSFLRRLPAGTEGLVVQGVLGPAAQAGIELDDVITHIDGRRLSTRDELLGYVRAKSPGQTVTLTLLRDGAHRRVKITLDSLERRRR